MFYNKVDKRISIDNPKNVGPSSYTPSYRLVKFKGNTAVSKFSHDKVQRNIFRANKNIPGPGQYETTPTEDRLKCKY